MKKNKILYLFLTVFFISTLLLTNGCKLFDSSSEKTPEPPKTQLTAKKITLYFSDKDAIYLVPEIREVKIDKNADKTDLAEKIVKELIKGPEDENLFRTIPPEAKLLGIEIKDEIAYADFSEEIKTKHWGGSTGETMTVMSIVNSLTELEGIKKVQILIEGKTEETLVGHLYTKEPLERDKNIIKPQD
ncbi:GerMN domain-containing protein [Thermosyntropha sp.]|uniref:GerMN domain-containing protein n=1 Tax=Thermosyntropha sp. TaxID=2740820 RepID=UPI0025FA4DDE|nr:GerMN domain-containing protein [Thermosyntropha sp.]MBO8158296.1 GerMN domain-containing protein [Thermosyntropha sp.]